MDETSTPVISPLALRLSSYLAQLQHPAYRDSLCLNAFSRSQTHRRPLVTRSLRLAEKTLRRKTSTTDPCAHRLRQNESCISYGRADDLSMIGHCMGWPWSYKLFRSSVLPCTKRRCQRLPAAVTRNHPSHYLSRCLVRNAGGRSKVDLEAAFFHVIQACNTISGVQCPRGRSVHSRGVIRTT